VVDKAELGQIFSQYFGVPSHSFDRLFHTYDLLSGAGTIGQRVIELPSGLNLTPPQESKNISTYVPSSVKSVPVLCVLRTRNLKFVMGIEMCNVLSVHCHFYL
jgi:hypothetical protein